MMKIYLIVALFLGALVVANSLEADEEEKVEIPDEQPEEEASDPPDGTEGDAEEASDPPDGTEGDTEESESEDDEDDAVEKRRLSNSLSSFSCRRLKGMGYCRHAFIKNLCRLTCRAPPPCIDKLSRLSCIRIRAYRKCRYSIARVYCRRTCGSCGGSGPCRRYRILSQIYRRKSRPSGNRVGCDKSGFVPGWYRFTGFAGNGMPTRPPPINRCGTSAPGWMRGSYPRFRNQVVSRTVCFHWNRNTCRWRTSIRVKNCGRYYVFYLPKTPVCNLRYCGNA